MLPVIHGLEKTDLTEHTMMGTTLDFGKGSKAGIKCQGFALMEIQAQIICKPNPGGRKNVKYVLIDLGAICRTEVNGEKISGEHLLRDGDVIQVGKSSFRFTWDKDG